MKYLNPWKTKSKTIKYQNPWIKVEHHEVQNPADNPGIYGIVKFKNYAIGIVPVDAEGCITLVGQWRYPLHEYSWEIPEGGGPMDQSPLSSAKRELLEETGLIAKHWVQLCDLSMSNSVTNERGMVFLAQDLEQKTAEPEETEVLTLKKVPLKEAVDMIFRGEIHDALAVAGIFAAHHYLNS